MQYRPKTKRTYIYGERPFKSIIKCYSSSRWNLEFRDRKTVILNHGTTTIGLAIDEFENHWKEVEG